MTFSGKFLPDLVTGMGYAFAVTSYSKDGLAIVQGVADVVDLVHVFKQSMRAPQHVFLAGVSEGGLVTALALEQHPETFSGGLSLCGPIGNFQRQFNYTADFRVLFDYFFPGVLPPSIDIPQWLKDNWYKIFEPYISQLIIQNPHTAEQLLRVGRAPDPNNPATWRETILEILKYDIFAANDAIETLGGRPFDNRFTFYSGSSNDFRLNLRVQRIQADPEALAEIQAHYQTSGKLNRFLVSMHNTADPIVPYWQEIYYLTKVIDKGSWANFASIPINRYGHVNLTESEVLAGFALLVARVTGEDLLVAGKSVLKEPTAIGEFVQLGKQLGAFK